MTGFVEEGLSIQGCNQVPVFILKLGFLCLCKEQVVSCVIPIAVACTCDITLLRATDLGKSGFLKPVKMANFQQHSVLQSIWQTQQWEGSWSKHSNDFQCSASAEAQESGSDVLFANSPMNEKCAHPSPESWPETSRTQTCIFGSRCEIMILGSPCCLKMFSINCSASVGVRMKGAILDSWHTTTRIDSYPLLLGHFSLKSREIDSQGDSRMGIGSSGDELTCR